MWGEKKRVDQRPEPGQIGVGFPEFPEWDSPGTETNDFDCVLRGIEKKEFLKSRTEMWGGPWENRIKESARLAKTG